MTKVYRGQDKHAAGYITIGGQAQPLVEYDRQSVATMVLAK
jgi:hypothetical protein